VRGLAREPGFTPTPGIWNVTPGGGAGGVWMSGSGPAIDGSDIYLATGNGMDPGTIPGNFGESFVKLRYTPGVSGVNNGKPALVVNDFWAAFSDFGRQDEDQDLGAAGVFIIPEHGNLFGGGKDGILYNLDKNNLGKDTWTPQFNLPFVATYLPTGPNGGAGLATTTAPDPNWPIVNRDRNLHTQTPTRKSHHIHGTPVYMGRATGGIVYLWGENERLKAYNFDFATKRITGFRGQGTQFASGAMDPPGGMPGGRLVVSSNGTAPRTGVVWGVYPVQGNANSEVVPGALVAYDATAVTNGTMRQLFHSDARPGDELGAFAKYATPVVANGHVYVATFSNKVVQYGLGAVDAGLLTRGRTPTRTLATRAAAPAAAAPPVALSPSASASGGLGELSAMTFDCPRAGLNAAAREAAKTPSQGTYQFSFFRIISNSHHAAYEVHFKSNVASEPDLKYCVAMYCQQGWDPKTSETSVRLLANAPARGKAATHASRCGHERAAARRVPTP
jgi:hypothetical protein